MCEACWVATDRPRGAPPWCGTCLPATPHAGAPPFCSPFVLCENTTPFARQDTINVSSAATTCMGSWLSAHDTTNATAATLSMPSTQFFPGQPVQVYRRMLEIWKYTNGKVYRCYDRVAKPRGGLLGCLQSLRHCLSNIFFVFPVAFVSFGTSSLWQSSAVKEEEVTLSYMSLKRNTVNESFSVGPEDPQRIAVIRRTIGERLNLAPEDVMLRMNGKQLVDGKPLKHYDFQPSATISACPKLKGGMEAGDQQNEWNDDEAVSDCPENESSAPSSSAGVVAVNGSNSATADSSIAAPKSSANLASTSNVSVPLTMGFAAFAALLHLRWACVAPPY